VRELLRSVDLPDEDLEGTDFLGHFGSRGKLLGVVGFQASPPYCLLRSLAVDPSSQGKGIGSALVRHALGLMAGSFEKVYLYTEGQTGFFKRFGFEVVSPVQVPAEISSLPIVSSCCRYSATPMVLDLFQER